jgi:hypothetical protein
MCCESCFFFAEPHARASEYNEGKNATDVTHPMCLIILVCHCSAIGRCFLHTSLARKKKKKRLRQPKESYRRVRLTSTERKQKLEKKKKQRSALPVNPSIPFDSHTRNSVVRLCCLKTHQQVLCRHG